MSNPLSIVVDADIARSSGKTEHPISSGSRALLEGVSSNGHKLTMCPSMMTEWKKHKSLFAKKWLSSMIAKKKVVFVNPVPQVHDVINMGFIEETKVKIAEKDAHLVDAAIFSDRVIASNDDRARSVFCELSNNCGDLKTIKWFNAISDREFIDTFLSTQCYVPEQYYVREAGAA